MSFITYAQNLEDVLLWRALGHVKGGFYIDVGANDPVEHSVTKAFYDAGWNGVNIEPLPSFHEPFVNQRPRDINLAVAAGASEGSITLFDVTNVNGWASTDPDVAATHRSQGYDVVELKVPMRTLSSIWAEHVAGEVHFLKIDVEGFEGEVLRGLNLRLQRPWILVIEATMPNSRETNHESWEHLVTDCDYRFAYFDGLNRYYVAVEHTALHASLTVQANVFDDFISFHLDNAWRDGKALREQLLTQQERVAELQDRIHHFESVRQTWDLLSIELHAQRAETSAQRVEASAQRTEASNLRAEAQKLRDDYIARYDAAISQRDEADEKLTQISVHLDEVRVQRDHAVAQHDIVLKKIADIELQLVVRNADMVASQEEIERLQAAMETMRKNASVPTSASREREAALLKRLEATAQRAEEFETRLHAAAAWGQDLHQQLIACGAWGNDLDRQLIAAREAGQESERVLYLLRTSRSWQLTAPMRVATTIYRRLNGSDPRPLRINRATLRSLAGRTLRYLKRLSGRQVPVSQAGSAHVADDVAITSLDYGQNRTTDLPRPELSPRARAALSTLERARGRTIPTKN